MPVYFTTELAEYLSLLQYPHRWKHQLNNYSPDVPLAPKSQARRALQARTKPKVGALELSVPIEGPTFASYSNAKGAEMGKGVEATDLAGPKAQGGKKRVNPEETGPLERMAFRAEPLADQTNYCVGLLANGAPRALLVVR
jgi:hypothetical protein